MHKDIVTFANDEDTFYFNNREYFQRHIMKNKHFHNNYEIYYLVYGERNYFVKDRAYLVKKGDLMLVNKNDLHKTYDGSTTEHQRILINFKKSFFEKIDGSADDILNILFSESYPITSLPVNKQIYIEGLLNKFAFEIQSKDIGFELTIQSLLIELLVFLARYKKTSTVTSIKQLSPIHEKVYEVIQYINKNYTEPLSLPIISKCFFISPYYLSRIFKESTGFTFVEYINSIRVKKAQAFLWESNFKVTTISDMVGFGSISQFGRVFKSITGLSPLDYRNSEK